MPLTKAEQPPKIIKGVTSGSRGSSRLPLLEEIKKDGTEGTWYVLGTWDNPATAGKFARGISRANTPRAKAGDPACPPGRWEGGVEPLAHNDSAQVLVRYLGDAEANGEDPFR